MNMLTKSKVDAKKAAIDAKVAAKVPGCTKDWADKAKAQWDQLVKDHKARGKYDDEA